MNAFTLIEKKSIDLFVGIPYYTARIFHQKNLPIIIKKDISFTLFFIHLSSCMLVVSAKTARKVHKAEIEK